MEAITIEVPQVRASISERRAAVKRQMRRPTDCPTDAIPGARARNSPIPNATVSLCCRDIVALFGHITPSSDRIFIDQPIIQQTPNMALRRSRRNAQILRKRP